MTSLSVIDSLKQRGNEYFKTGGIIDAINSYSEALKILTTSRLPSPANETTVLLFQNRAACFLRLGRNEECVRDCDNALELNPTSIKALYRRACALEKLERFSDSKRDALVILKLEPHNKDAVNLMRRLNQVSAGSGTQGLHRLLDDLIRTKDPNSMMQCIEMIRAYCEDDEEKHFAFAKSSGLVVVDRILLENNIENEEKLLQSVLRLLLSLCQYQSIVDSFVIFEADTCFDDQQSGVASEILSRGKLSVHKLAVYGGKLQNSELQQKLLLLLMAILKHTKVLKEDVGGVETENLNHDCLQLGRNSVFAISHWLINALKTFKEPKTFQFVCDTIGSFISDFPDYFSNVQLIDTPHNLESIEQRKRRNRTSAAAHIRSKFHVMCLIECDIIHALISTLNNADPTIRSNSSICLGKIFKYLDDEGMSQSLLKPYFSTNQTGAPDILMTTVQCHILQCLLSTQPNLGAWALTEGGGVMLLNTLISSREPSLVALASEISCLAAGNEKASACLQPLVASGILNGFLAHSDVAVQAAGAAALAKLAIKAKALNQSSSENAIILNSATHVIKRSNLRSIKETSIERAIEILASMVGKSYVKQELVFGSSRVTPVIAELCSIEVDERSTASYGLAFIFANLTVTNWELRALALAEKDISVDQYEKMMELQRIKTVDDNGNPMEERKEDEDTDTMDMCKSRCFKIVQCGGLKTILKLAEFHSEQTSLAAIRTFRQICVDESSRGLFIQQGGLKFCTDFASNDSKSKAMRQEASHAIAKSLVTTNPHLLSDSLRLSSIRPLLFLCQNSDSNDLQRFESLLALTNVISCGRNEQDKFVHERGIPIVHYLVFHDNLSIRQASVETLCNLSSHESMCKILHQDNNIKLWLGLIEEWLNDLDNPVALKTAKAAAGTLAMCASDLGVASALSRNSCVATFTSVLQNGENDMTHRILVAILEMLGNQDSHIIAQLKQNDLLVAMCEMETNEEQHGIVGEIVRLLN